MANLELVGDRVGERAGERVGEKVWVDIFVAAGCYSCIYSKEVAAGIRQDFPQVRVRLIDIAVSPDRIPEEVFATPTYLLNDRLWSLGNPSPQDVRDRLSAALADAESGVQPLSLTQSERRHHEC